MIRKLTDVDIVVPCILIVAVLCMVVAIAGAVGDSIWFDRTTVVGTVVGKQFEPGDFDVIAGGNGGVVISSDAFILLIEYGNGPVAVKASPDIYQTLSIGDSVKLEVCTGRVLGIKSFEIVR